MVQSFLTNLLIDVLIDKDEIESYSRTQQNYEGAQCEGKTAWPLSFEHKFVDRVIEPGEEIKTPTIHSAGIKSVEEMGNTRAPWTGRSALNL
jgi:hypothetical protein